MKNTGFALSTVVLTCLIIVCSSPASGSDESFLGFAFGEERQYEIDLSGEKPGVHSIALVNVRLGDDGDWIGRFRIQTEYRSRPRDSFVGLVIKRKDAVLDVSSTGFPLEYRGEAYYYQYGLPQESVSSPRLAGTGTQGSSPVRGVARQGLPQPDTNVKTSFHYKFLPSTIELERKLDGQKSEDYSFRPLGENEKHLLPYERRKHFYLIDYDEFGLLHLPLWVAIQSGEKNYKSSMLWGYYPYRPLTEGEGVELIVRQRKDKSIKIGDEKKEARRHEVRYSNQDVLTVYSDDAGVILRVDYGQYRYTLKEISTMDPEVARERPSITGLGED